MKINSFEIYRISTCDRNFARVHYPGFVVLPGMEYTTCRIHMNIIGVYDFLPYFSGSEPYKFDPWPSDEDIQRIIRETHEQGGVIQVNHMPWSTNNQNNHRESTLPRHPTREELLSWGVDYFEIVNHNVFDYQSASFCDYSRAINSSSVCAGLTGTDMHSPRGAAAWTTLNIKNFSSNDYNYSTFKNDSFTYSSPPLSSHVLERLVMDELRAKRVGFLYDPTMIQYQQVVRPEENDNFYKTAQFYYLGEYIQNLFYKEGKTLLLLSFSFVLYSVLKPHALSFFYVN